ncbi:MAG: PilZ domain-containing protein [Nitrospira sp.]|nr:hypothetical protein [Nitrospira sp. WS238]
MSGLSDGNRESRKIQRYAVQLPCTFGSDGDRSDGVVLNLSAQGCAVTAQQLPLAATHLSLQIDLLNDEAPVDIELAAVRWVSGPRCGVEFIKVVPDMLVKLRAFVLLLDEAPY